MGKMNKNAVKMFSVSDPDFEEKNMMIFEGTPAECWTAIRDANRLVRNLQEKTVVPDGRLRRDIVKMYAWIDGKDPLDSE